MNEQDIRYRDILGHGNGGTVYKWVVLVGWGGFAPEICPQNSNFTALFVLYIDVV